MPLTSVPVHSQVQLLPLTGRTQPEKAEHAVQKVTKDRGGYLEGQRGTLLLSRDPPTLLLSY